MKHTSGEKARRTRTAAKHLVGLDGPANGHETRRALLSTAGAAGAGAALMYLLDPDRGTRRRKLAGDKVIHAAHAAEEALEKSGRDLRNRAVGAAQATRHRIKGDDADDRVLIERVRAELGRVVSHPGAIEVNVEDGRAILTGPVLASETDRLLRRVRKVRGIRDVEDRLEVHESAEGVPALQGGVARTGDKFELRQENWTPGARLLTTAAGGALALYGRKRRGIMGAALGLAGMALAARGATNKQLKRVVGTGGGRRAVNIQKTINIDAPLEEVFAFMTDYENWPRFMTNVREVREPVPGLQHWAVDGPAGTTVEWEAEITRFAPNEMVAWKSVAGSAVRHAGTMQFDSNEDGSTRVHVQMSYNPPAGVAGHALAVLLRADPKRQMDEDFARVKTMIETGKPPHDAAIPSGDVAGVTPVLP